MEFHMDNRKGGEQHEKLFSHRNGLCCEPKELTEEMIKKLRAPLPDEAITQHPTKTFLSSIKAIYVTERLNEVFGIGRWKTSVEHESTQLARATTAGDMVVVKLTFEVPEYGIYYECYGGNDNKDLGDAYKGAMTDAITKVGSYLEIGIDVFKGKHTATAKPTAYKARTPRVALPTPEQRTEIEKTDPFADL